MSRRRLDLDQSNGGFGSKAPFRTAARDFRSCLDSRRVPSADLGPSLKKIVVNSPEAAPRRLACAVRRLNIQTSAC
jgi:hypothetical protein